MSSFDDDDGDGGGQFCNCRPKTRRRRSPLMRLFANLLTHSNGGQRRKEGRGSGVVARERLAPSLSPRNGPTDGAADDLHGAPGEPDIRVALVYAIVPD